MLTWCLFSVEIHEGSALQGVRFPHLSAGRQRTQCVYMDWGRSRECCDQTAGISEIAVMPGMSRGTGMPAQWPWPPCPWNGASSLRAIKKVWVTKSIVFNHLFLKWFKFSSLPFFFPHELSFVCAPRSCLLLWSGFLSWLVFSQWLAIVLISSEHPFSASGGKGIIQSKSQICFWLSFLAGAIWWHIFLSMLN